MKKPVIFAALIALTSCTPCRYEECPEQLTTINIIDRNGLSETISNPDRLEQYSRVDFLKQQPYEKVLRVYGRDPRGNVKSCITSYHPNGQPKQYLEIMNTRAYGTYREWHANGTMRVDTFVIGGEADITPASEKTWLFEGNARAWNENGTLIADIQYCRGELDGPSIYYHPSGSIRKTVPFVQGAIHGTVRMYYENGDLQSTQDFVRGQRHGPAAGYWSSENLSYEEEYRDGLLVNARYYKKNGELASEVCYGSGFQTVCCQDGSREELEYKNGIQEGLVKVYDRDGVLTNSFHIKNDVKNGLEVAYYCNPFTKETLHPKLALNWRDGQIQGIVKTWYDNGIQESQREMSSNKKNGVSTAWYRDGSIMILEEYEKDRLVKGEYYKKGEKRPVSKVKEGNGEATFYDADGNFIEKVPYFRGVPEE